MSAKDTAQPDSRKFRETGSEMCGKSAPTAPPLGYSVSDGASWGALTGPRFQVRVDYA